MGGVVGCGERKGEQHMKKIMMSSCLFSLYFMFHFRIYFIFYLVETNIVGNELVEHNMNLEWTQWCLHPTLSLDHKL